MLHSHNVIMDSNSIRSIITQHYEHKLRRSEHVYSVAALMGFQFALNELKFT